MTKPYSTNPDPEEYKLVQRQRVMERRVRQRKREVEAKKAWAGEDKSLEARRALSQSERMLGKAKSDLNQLVSDNDLKRLRYREQVGRAI